MFSVLTQVCPIDVSTQDAAVMSVFVARFQVSACSSRSDNSWQLRSSRAQASRQRHVSVNAPASVREWVSSSRLVRLLALPSLRGEGERQVVGQRHPRRVEAAALLGAGRGGKRARVGEAAAVPLRSNDAVEPTPDCSSRVRGLACRGAAHCGRWAAVIAEC